MDILKLNMFIFQISFNIIKIKIFHRMLGKRKMKFIKFIFLLSQISANKKEKFLAIIKCK